MLRLKVSAAPVLLLLAVMAASSHDHPGHRATNLGGLRTPSRQETHGKQMSVHPIQWVVRGRPGESHVRIGNMVGWCPDTGLVSRPRIEGVRQVSRPGAVILTAYLAQSNPPGCLDVEIRVEYVVHIRGGLRERPLYDGSRSPLERRWPR